MPPSPLLIVLAVLTCVLIVGVTSRWWILLIHPLGKVGAAAKAMQHQLLGRTLDARLRYKELGGYPDQVKKIVLFFHLDKQLKDHVSAIQEWTILSVVLNLLLLLTMMVTSVQSGSQPSTWMTTAMIGSVIEMSALFFVVISTWSIRKAASEIEDVL